MSEQNESEQRIPVDPQSFALVLDQRYRLYDSLNAANDKADGRITMMVQTGGIIIGLVAIFNLPGGGILDAIQKGVLLKELDLLFTLCAFLFFLSTLIVSAYLMRPIERGAPGDWNWERTYDKYLHSDKCEEQILYDLFLALESSKELNEYKATWLPRLTLLLILQVICLALAVLLA